MSSNPVAEGTMDGTDMEAEKVAPTAVKPTGKSANIIVRAWHGYEHALGSFVGFLSQSYGRLGSFTATRPILVLSISVIAALAICIGWARFRIEDDPDVLWVPQTGKARDDQDFVKANYPRSKDGASFYAQLAPSQYAAFGGNNAVQIPVTWEMFQLHQKVLQITVNGDDGQPKTFKDLCYRNQDGTCSEGSGYLWYWYKNFNYFITAVQGSPTDPAAGNVTAFRQQVSNVSYPDGQPVSLLSVFGGTTFSYNPFQLQAAQVIAQDYALNDTVSDGVAKDWNLAFISLMEDQSSKLQYSTITYISGSSVGEELGKSINNDMPLIIISLIVFIIVAVIILSKWSYKTRTTLALAGVVVIALGIMSGWGWGMIFGMPFTSLQQLSPFILLGMGLDVAFILVKAYDIIIQREPWLTLPESFGKLMSTAGTSVQVTLLASAVAFALGSADELASVKWFSAYATLNTLMIMILMMTAFIACMVLVEKRIGAGRWDCCCCITSSAAPAHSGSQVVTGLPVVAAPQPDSSFTRGQAIHDDSIADENLVKKFFRKYYAPALTKWYVKVPIILFFLTWAVASWYGIYQIEYGQPLSDLAPDGSYVQTYDEEQQRTYAQQVGEPVGLYFRNIDVSNPTEQWKMLMAWDMALNNEFVNSSTTAFLGAWLINFLSYAQDRGLTVVQPINNCYNPLVGKVTGNLAGVITPVVINGCIPQAQFYPLLKQWLGGKINNNIIRRADGTIYSSKLPLMQTPSAGDDKYNQQMIKHIREEEVHINELLFQAENDQYGEDSAFIYGSSYVFAEGDAILNNQALLFFILALVGVGVVCTFMLVNPGASLLMMIAVGLVILFLFGELWALHIKFNQVSIINMIMATGLSVDYSVYFAQKFMTTVGDGTGNSRMSIALTDTGFAVFLGGLTALLGSVPIAFSKSVIIRTFFLLIFGTVLFSLAVGLILMPVLFSLLPLPPITSSLMSSSTYRQPTSTPLPDKERTFDSTTEDNGKKLARVV